MAVRMIDKDVREAFKVLYRELNRLHSMTAHFEIEAIDLGDITCLQLLHMTAITYGMTDEQFNDIANEIEKEGK